MFWNLTMHATPVVDKTWAGTKPGAGEKISKTISFQRMKPFLENSEEILFAGNSWHSCQAWVGDFCDKSISFTLILASVSILGPQSWDVGWQQRSRQSTNPFKPCHLWVGRKNFLFDANILLSIVTHLSTHIRKNVFVKVK